MSAAAVFSIILFILLVSIFSLGLIDTTTTTVGNQTNTNLTIITGGSGVAQTRICDFQSDIPFFGGLIWGADCIADWIGFIFSLFTVNSAYQWLGFILVAAFAVLGYIVVKLLRGGG